jgi:hypothetical protein
MKLTQIPILAAALAMCACGAPQGDTGPNKADESAANRALLDAAEQPLERARAVEDIAAGRKAELDGAIEESAQ